jgi:hypothetical protein
MRRNYIDFISEYCDRWCERCAFTERCSTFAATAAIAMCGDVDEGLELALGRPHHDEPGRASLPSTASLDAGDESNDLEGDEPAEEEVAEFQRREKARSTRVRASTLSKASWAYTVLAHKWVASEYEALRQHSEPALQEALAVVLHDQHLIGLKIHRALHGRERDGEGLSGGHAVQNDWNGSARVAIISLERSEAAWRVIAGQATGEVPLIMAGCLADLRREVEREFPDARRFVRPGFDDLQAT